jgi:hypothetical protein
VPQILPALIGLALEPNMRMWWSVDRETGWPDAVPPGVSVCYLDDGQGVQDADEADLVFRIKRLRLEVPTLYPLRLICPNERPGGKDTQCSDCQRCWSDEA